MTELTITLDDETAHQFEWLLENAAGEENVPDPEKFAQQMLSAKAFERYVAAQVGVSESHVVQLIEQGQQQQLQQQMR